MAIGKGSDFKIYDEQFYGGMFERISQFVALFNAGSAGAVRLVQAELKGNYNKESFLKDVASLVTRRDLTSVLAATDLAMTQGELIGVKINRKFGPVAQTLDAWRKIGSDQQEMSLKLGQMMAEKKIQDYVNTALLAVEAGLTGLGASFNVDKTGASPDTLTHTYLVDGLACMGDISSRIVAFAMHSKPYFDLVKQSIADKIVEVAGVTIIRGTVASFNRPIIVTDAPALLETGAPNVYPVLGLVEGSIVVTESEQQEIVSQIVTGLEQLAFRIQGEYAFNLNVKGLQWDTGAGGANPDDTAVGTSTNWDLVASNAKDGPGFRLLVN